MITSKQSREDGMFLVWHLIFVNLPSFNRKVLCRCYSSNRQLINVVVSGVNDHRCFGDVAIILGVDEWFFLYVHIYVSVLRVVILSIEIFLKDEWF